MQGQLLSPERLDEARGEVLYSSEEEEIGSIAEIFLDKQTRKPEWFAVGAGLLGGKRRLIPVAGAERGADGIRVPYSAEQIQATPEIEGGEVSQDTERVLYSTYGLEYSERRSDSGLPAREEAQPSRRASERGGRTETRGRRSDDEPTRDELYAEARKLEIPGRSKMNKRQLAQAVGRRRGRSESTTGKANPIEVQKFLEGVGYPTGKRQLVQEAKSQRASGKVRSTLERLPDQEFTSPTDVSEAIGNLR